MFLIPGHVLSPFVQVHSLSESSCPYTMSTPYYGPDEDENTINIERFFLAGDFVSGVGYGV